MARQKNEHVVPKNKKWAVRREGSEKVSKLFETQREAMDYAGNIAKKDDVSMIVHKHNGKFKNFKQGYEIHVKVHKILPIIIPLEVLQVIEPTEEVQVVSFPIVNNTQPIIQTMASV